MLSLSCRRRARLRGWVGLIALVPAIAWRTIATQPVPAAGDQSPPTPPFPTLAPTDPFPTLPPNVPTPSLFTATATRASAPSRTPTPPSEASPTPPTAAPIVSPSPPFDLEVPLLLPYLGLNHLALDPQLQGGVRRDTGRP